MVHYFAYNTNNNHSQFISNVMDFDIEKYELCALHTSVLLNRLRETVKLSWLRTMVSPIWVRTTLPLTAVESINQLKSGAGLPTYCAESKQEQMDI